MTNSRDEYSDPISGADPTTSGSGWNDFDDDSRPTGQADTASPTVDLSKPAEAASPATMPAESRNAAPERPTTGELPYPEHGAGRQDGQSQYGQQQYGQNQNGQQQYGRQGYGDQQFGQNPYGQGQYGQMVPQGQGSAPIGVVGRKEPALMLVASFFIPGLGTILNGEVGKGVGILIGYFISCLLSAFLIGIPFAIGFWIWGLVDAYQGAVRFNRRHGIYT